ncbi:succinate dehydrogenase/fumarate reductase iron-sulfur subunit [Chloroflexota bacterium]
MPDRISAKIFRYIPSIDSEPTYKTYEIPWREYITVLEVLKYIHECFEPISFDWGCRIARCGTCGVRVNNKPCLACVTLVSPGEILIEPLDNLSIVRDLIVDRTQVNEVLYSIDPWLCRSAPLAEVPTLSYEAYEKLEALQLCIDCLLCHSICPVVKSEGITKFAGPNIMLKIAMRYYDPRDEAKDKRLQTAVKLGLMKCNLCGACAEVCPQGYHDDSQQHIQVEHMLGFTTPKAGLLDADQAYARRFSVELPIDHLFILEDLQKKAKQ